MGSVSPAPAPAKPTTCSDPMLDANMEVPTTNHPILRPAQKYASVLLCFFLIIHTATPANTKKYSPIQIQSSVSNVFIYYSVRLFLLFYLTENLKIVSLI